MQRTVLLINATYEPLHVCSPRRALNLILKEKAIIVECSKKVYHSSGFDFPVPYVIRLTYYVRVPRQSRRKISRRAVLARDNHTCQYCGNPTHLTIDHIVPRSRGGPSDWANIVTSCAPCNLQKGNKLPHEAGMRLRSKPRIPDPVSFLFLGVCEVHHSWEQYLV